jgi:hypothetical protein
LRLPRVRTASVGRPGVMAPTSVNGLTWNDSASVVTPLVGGGSGWRILSLPCPRS